VVCVEQKIISDKMVIKEYKTLSYCYQFYCVTMDSYKLFDLLGSGRQSLEMVKRQLHASQQQFQLSR